MLEFLLLGPLVVRFNGIELAIPPGRRHELLAKLLLHQGRPVRKDELIDLLWPSCSPERARHTLDSTFTRLRQPFTDAGTKLPVTKRAMGYIVTLAPGQLDVTTFEERCVTARKAAVRDDWAVASATFDEALSLCRGEPLEGIDCPGLAEYKMILSEKILMAWEDRLDADLHLGRHREILGDVRRLAARQPLRERAHESLMLALYRCGNPTEALDVYRDFRDRFVDGIGVEPGPTLQKLQQQILARAPELDLPR